MKQGYKAYNLEGDKDGTYSALIYDANLRNVTTLTVFFQGAAHSGPRRHRTGNLGATSTALQPTELTGHSLTTFKEINFPHLKNKVF